MMQADTSRSHLYSHVQLVYGNMQQLVLEQSHLRQVLHTDNMMQADTSRSLLLSLKTSAKPALCVFTMQTCI